MNNAHAPNGEAVNRCFLPAAVPSKHHDVMTTKQTTARWLAELAENAEAIARVHGTNLNGLIIDSLASEVERV
jgi:hypothetical protein